MFTKELYKYLTALMQSFKINNLVNLTVCVLLEKYLLSSSKIMEDGLVHRPKIFRVIVYTMDLLSLFCPRVYNFQLNRELNKHVFQ